MKSGAASFGESLRRSRGAGLVAAFGSVALVTAVIYPVKGVAPVVSTGVLYLLAVLLVSSLWGLWFGLGTALLSALAFNFFHIPPTGRFTIGEAENWVALAVFLVTAVVVSTLAELARSRAEQADRRGREAELAAELAQLFSSNVSVDASAAEAGELAAAALKLDDVEISVGRFAVEGPNMRLLRANGAVIGSLKYRGELAPDSRVVLEESVAPAIEALLATAIERQRLTDELVQQEALRRSDELKTALLRAVSHDLRSPLTAIAAAGEALQSPSIGQEDRAELARAVSEEADRLTNVVEKLLDLSRLEAGEFKPRREWSSLEEIVETAASALGEGRARVKLHVEGELPLLQVDAAMLDRAFANLLENALRHSGEEVVTVTLRATPTEVIAAVTDRGPGIGGDQLEAVFEPFHQAGGQQGGAGLGLAIVRGMVEANGGTVRAESLPSQGATFTVTLPREQERMEVA